MNLFMEINMFLINNLYYHQDLQELNLLNKYMNFHLTKNNLNN